MSREVLRLAYALMIRRLRDAGAVIDTRNMDPAVRPHDEPQPTRH